MNDFLDRLYAPSSIFRRHLQSTARAGRDGSSSVAPPLSCSVTALPPYAQRVTAALLATRKGKDLVLRGTDFPDASFLVLDGYRAGTSPSPLALHPHASSYAGSDYLTPLLLLVAVRSIQLPRSSTYKEAEIRVLRGLAAQLESLDEHWFWGLVPLHLIEDDRMRTAAVRLFCQRNAMRASRLLHSTSTAETGMTSTRKALEEMVEWLHIPPSLLRPVEPSEMLQPIRQNQA